MESNVNIIADEIYKGMDEWCKIQKKEDEERIEYFENNIKTYMQNIKEYVKKINDIKTKTYDTKKLKEKLITDLQLIAKHPLCEGIHFNEDRLIIDTNTIYMTEFYTGKRYLLGKMKIEIPLNIEKHILFTNKDGNIYDGYHHPHVFSNQTACFGNALEGVAIYRSTEEYYALYITLINFLQQADVEDQIGVNICMWDEVDENDNVVCKGHYPEIDEYDGYGNNIIDEESYEMCAVCGNTYSRDEIYYCADCDMPVCEEHHVVIDGIVVCDDCYEKYYTECENCGKEVHRDNLYYTDDGYGVCEECYDNANKCEYCESIFLNEKMHEFDNRILCKNCYKEAKEDKENEDSEEFCF